MPGTGGEAAFLFGSSNGAEEYLTAEGIRGLPECWEAKMTKAFCTTSAVAFYLYQFERLGLENDGQTAVYAGGLIADYPTQKITKNGAVIRDHNNIFVPMTWEAEAVLVYSEEGYTGRNWKLTEEWTSGCDTVDVFENTKDGRRFLTTIAVVDGAVMLDVTAGQMLILKPHI